MGRERTLHPQSLSGGWKKGPASDLIALNWVEIPQSETDRYLDAHQGGFNLLSIAHIQL